jgi:hypothetical protein
MVERLTHGYNYTTRRYIVADTVKINLCEEIAFAMLKVLRQGSESEQIEAAKVLLSLADGGLRTVEVTKKE